jgi:hypothetical protein
MIGLRKRARSATRGLDEARLRPSSRVVAAERDGCTVLLDLRGERYFGLDESGTRFWALLSVGRTIDETAAELAAEYDAPVERLAADARSFAERLVSVGLLEVA